MKHAQYTDDFTDVLNHVISGMEFPIEIISVEDNGAGIQTLTCANIYHAQKGFFVTINDKKYEITAFDQGLETITLKPTFKRDPTIEAGDNFLLYKPFFFHGTPVATDMEIKDTKSEDKTPMIWLWENFKGKKKNDLDPVGQEVTCELYFLTVSYGEMQTLLTDDLYNECIKAMRRLLESFEAEIKKRQDVFSSAVWDYEWENYSKFAVMIRTKGGDKQLIMDKLSGISMKTTFKIWDDFVCPDAPVLVNGIEYDRIGETLIVY